MSMIICALYAGIARNAKCQWLLWDSYAGIAKNVKGQRLLWDLYAGITINAKCMWLFWTYMQVLHIRKWSYGVHNRK
jgi:hypothetical protein